VQINPGKRLAEERMTKTLSQPIWYCLIAFACRQAMKLQYAKKGLNLLGINNRSERSALSILVSLIGRKIPPLQWNIETIS
jgi:hypothetical protein